MNNVVVGWAWRRLREVSTYVGLGLIAAGNAGINSPDPRLGPAIQIFNTVAPIVGGLLAGASTTHP
jgi:hypothetical protein